MPLRLRMYQCGSPRKRGEGIRIGAVRFRPRGVLKTAFQQTELLGWEVAA